MQREKLDCDAVVAKVSASGAGIWGGPVLRFAGITSLNCHKALMEEVLSLLPFCRCRG